MAATVSCQMLVLGVTYPVVTHTSRPWYAKSNVNEGGSGRLPEMGA